MSYMDMSFCAGSKEGWSATGRSLCKNTKCPRHACHIPFDALPTWEVFTVTDFSGVCEDYQPEEKG